MQTLGVAKLIMRKTAKGFEGKPFNPEKLIEACRQKYKNATLSKNKWWRVFNDLQADMYIKVQQEIDPVTKMQTNKYYYNAEGRSRF